MTDTSAEKILLPKPSEIPLKEKEDAMGAYLMMFAAMGAGLPLPLINLLASIIYFFVNKKTSKFVAFHSLQSLITQIPISVLNAGLIFWFIRMLITENFVFDTIFFSYLYFIILWNLVYTIYSIIACVQARKGKFFYMLFFGHMVFNVYYSKNRKEKPENDENLPPKGY